MPPGRAQPGEPMIELSRTDLDIGIVAYDTHAMLTFYGDILGLPSQGTMRVPGIGTLHRFGVGSSLLKVLEPETRPSGPPAPGLPWEAAGARYSTLHVSDLTSVMAMLTERGVESPTGVVEPAPGIRYAIVKDPDGNGVELVEGA
jgi:catechol 2,3-dioxygenase-like lactoylglutathione lyase family enzyme